jgi:hypothetical protein
MKRYTPEDWFPYLMPMLPGITEEFLLVLLDATLREFCEDGRSWTEIIGPLSSTANNPIIYLDPLPSNTRVGYVQLLTFSSNIDSHKRLTPMAQMPYLRPSSDQPVAYMMEDPGTINLNPIPTSDWPKAYTVDLSIIPLGPNIRLPEIFWTHWRDAIIDGVCGRAMMMISKPWSNPSIGTLHGKKFRNHIKRARAITDAKYTDAQAWAFPDFAKQRVGESFI